MIRRVAGAARARRLRELDLADAQELAAHVTRLARPRRQPERDHERVAIDGLNSATMPRTRKRNGKQSTTSMMRETIQSAAPP